jgi:hypothetical protein
MLLVEVLLLVQFLSAPLFLQQLALQDSVLQVLSPVVLLLEFKALLSLQEDGLQHSKASVWLALAVRLLVLVAWGGAWRAPYSYRFAML